MKVYSTDKNGETSFTMPFRSYLKGVNHRGYNTIAPENTLPAYILSAKNGFRFVETDISFTSDNVPVLLHDATINRTSNGSGSINSMTFAQVRQYDFGSWKSSSYAGTKIPSLEDFLVLCRNLGLHPYLEIKNDYEYSQAQLKKIVDIVEGYGMKGSVSYISFSSDYLAIIKTLDEYARLGFVCYGHEGDVETALSLKTGKNEVFLDSGSGGIQQCKDAGLPFERWTIDDKATIVSLDNYVSGVTSNIINAEFVKYEKSLG